MDSNYTQRYTTMLTLVAGILTAALASYFVIEKEFKPQTSERQIVQLEKVVNKLEKSLDSHNKILNLQNKILNLEEENKKLNEMVLFYKEKNEFFSKKLEEQNK